MGHFAVHQSHPPVGGATAPPKPAPIDPLLVGKHSGGSQPQPPPLSSLRLRYAYTSNTPANGSRAFFTTACTICEPTRTSRDDPHAEGGGLLRRAQCPLLATGGADTGGNSRNICGRKGKSPERDKLDSGPRREGEYSERRKGRILWLCGWRLSLSGCPRLHHRSPLRAGVLLSTLTMSHCTDVLFLCSHPPSAEVVWRTKLRVRGPRDGVLSRLNAILC